MQSFGFLTQSILHLNHSHESHPYLYLNKITIGGVNANPLSKEMTDPTNATIMAKRKFIFICVSDDNFLHFNFSSDLDDFFI